MSAPLPGMAVLLERDADQRLLDRALERAQRGSGGVVLVEAHAGVGKTELLRTAGSGGEAAGLRVLRSRGSELDRPFGLGVVRQLLERCVRESPDLLTGGAEPAAAVFMAAPGETTAEDRLFAHLHGLYWLAAISQHVSRWCCLQTTFTGPARRRCDGWCSSRSVSRICRSCSSARLGPLSRAPIRR